MLTMLLQYGLNLGFVLGLTLISVGLGRLILLKMSRCCVSAAEAFVFGAGLGFGIWRQNDVK
jgi:hypothetical protein